VAVENGNPYGVNGESSSAENCSSTSEIITVPNLFTPDGDLVNDLFKPVLSFIPENYHLVISDRKGKTVFESKSESEEWDGSLNGSPLPQDVYLWFLKATGPSGKSVTRTGTVTIIRVR
jgi:gliding motility-associated-like protein